MTEHEKKAREYFKNGYNCAQSVLLAYCEDFGLDCDTAIRMSASFGGGIGRLRQVCGAFSGGCMVLGLKYGNYGPKDREAKAENYRKVQAFAEKFQAENGSIICGELLKLPTCAPESPVPEERTQAYYLRRPCEEMVSCAARLLEDMEQWN